MSPTLLEVTVAVLLLWVAWQIGLLIAPHVLYYFRSNFRAIDPVVSSRPEKNVTPRTDPKMQHPPHGNPPSE